MLRVLIGFVVSSSALVVASAGPLPAQEPATLADAARVIDLRTFPLMPGGTARGLRRLAELDQVVRRPVGEAFAYQKKALEELGWKELPGGYLSDQSCSGTFGKGGFKVSVMVMPASGDNSAGLATILLKNLGNVDASELPVPPGAKLLYSFPTVTAYVTDAKVKETAESLRALLSARGWEPYGVAGDSMFFKKNAVRLTAWPSAAPAQGGKTVIQLSSELMSADLPAPPAFQDASYADSTRALSIEVASTPESLAAFYKEALGKTGWKATTERPFKDDFREAMIFRNDAKDISILKMTRVGDRLRATLDVRTEAEWNEAIAEAKARDEQRKAEAMRQAQAAGRGRKSVVVSVPGEARDVAYTSSDIRFKLDAGKGKAAAEAIRDGLVKAGWTDRPERLESIAGLVRLEKPEGISLVIVYQDAGFGDAEVTISAFGADVRSPEAP
ncbi:hypothetical protein [Aquisphaera insulae]|uniref:hypothetical protein n=1 Tax=Aquisphaera insulae TaxID=2712864 RepID=UPI0013EDC594|nr:hypothetical protein [Aquisphaera insulae]